MILVVIMKPTGCKVGGAILSVVGGDQSAIRLIVEIRLPFIFITNITLPTSHITTRRSSIYILSSALRRSDSCGD